jgi:hypothetical protein
MAGETGKDQQQQKLNNNLLQEKMNGIDVRRN